MSVRLMAEVFARYPRGGSEMLLALALADHAHDDGSSVRPSVRHLAEKTRQSERAVQYQIRNMEAEGWLQLVANAGGGRNNPREYRINPDWVRGANPAPLEKGANHDAKGCKPTHERVQQLLHPNHHLTIKNHQKSFWRASAPPSEAPAFRRTGSWTPHSPTSPPGEASPARRWPRS